MQIQAAVARQPNAPFTLETLELEEPRDDEVLVRIGAVGICHTDLVARDQLIPIGLPAVLGHEGAGVVERVGSAVTRVKAGDRVLLTFGSCGVCPRCSDHLPTYCQQFPLINYAGMRGDGSKALRDGDTPVSSHFFGQSSFATHAVAHFRNVVRIDDDLPLEKAAPLGCGIQTGAGSVMRSMACKAGSSLAVFGAGTVGLSAVMAAKIQGCAQIIAVDPLASRRQLALELGATHALDPGAATPEGIRAIVPAGLDYALDTSGRPAVMETALASLGSHGVLGLVGVPPTADSMLPVRIAGLITFGQQIKGIIIGDSEPEEFLPELIRLHKEGRFPFDRLIQTFPLSAINEAIAAQHDGSCVKPVLLTP